METPVCLPGSKSIAARALVCRLLSGHDTRIGNLPECGDTDSMLRLTKAIRSAAGPLRVDIGEGGTTLRFGMAACASLPGLDITLVGSTRLMARPHAVLIGALREMGADMTQLPGQNAIHIKGKQLTGGMLRLDGSVSSQYLSALMLSAPVWKENTLFRIELPVVSFPYITMTAGVMRDFGAHVSMVEKEDCLEVTVRADGYAQCARYDVEGDWSAASYFFEASLIQSTVRMAQSAVEPSRGVESLKTLKAPAESLQGDSRVAAIFGEASLRLKEGDRSVMHMNLNGAPDLVPAVAVGLCLAGIPFRIEGVAHLRHKESDRMAAITAEIRKLGFILDCGDDSMEWHGSGDDRCRPDENPVIRTYQDHRMAMAFAPARILFPTLKIENPEVVNKSFPSYWLEMEKFLKEDPSPKSPAE